MEDSSDASDRGGCGCSESAKGAGDRRFVAPYGRALSQPRTGGICAGKAPLCTNGVDPVAAIASLKAVVAKIPNVLATPSPDIEILELTAEGPKLCVRPYCHTEHYWQVYFDVMRAVVDTFGKAGYPTPETPVAHRLITPRPSQESGIQSRGAA